MSRWKARFWVWTTLGLFVAVSGCVVGDQLSTMTIHPDGSADVVTVRSNLRSTESGEKGEKELVDYKTQFNARTLDDFVRLREAGGTMIDSGWLRQDTPSANYITAHLPNSQALEQYASIKGGDGAQLTEAKFESQGTRRKFSLRITWPGAQADPSHLPISSVEELRQSLADGISETRIAVADGTIVSAQGFTVASDKQSALLDVSALDAIFRSGGTAELLIEWEVK